MLVGSINTGWRFDRFEFLSEQNILMQGDKIISLLDIETKLLMMLVHSGGDVVSKDEIITELSDNNDVTESYISVIVQRIRKNVTKSIISTVYGIGFRLGYPVEATGSVEEIHAVYITELFVRAERQLQTMSDPEWDRLYLSKIEEIRAALEWSLAIWTRRHIAIALFGACARVFPRLSLISEGRSYADRLIDLIDDDIRHAAVAQLLRSIGILWREEDRLRALALFQRSADLYRQLDDRLGLGIVLWLLGDAHLYLGQHETAQNYLEESVNILSIQGNTKSLMDALNGLGSVYAVINSPNQAKIYYDKARNIARIMKDTMREYIIVMNLCDLEFCQGATDRAITRSREAEEGLRSAPIPYRVRPVVNLSTYLALQGDWGESLFFARQALALAREVGGYWLRLCLQVWALLGVRAGFNVKAARLIGYIDADFSRSGDARQRPEQQLYDLVVHSLGETISQDSIPVWAREGARWTEAQAIDCAESLDKVSEIQ